MNEMIEYENIQLHRKIFGAIGIGLCSSPTFDSMEDEFKEKTKKVTNEGNDFLISFSIIFSFLVFIM